MPKIVPTELEKRRRMVKACISSKQELNGWSDDQLAKKCRFSNSTLKNRRSFPEKFTLEELWNMGITIYLYDGQSILPNQEGVIKIG